MVKVSSRDIIDILRMFDVASYDNVPRNIETVKLSHPNPINTLASFSFNRNQMYILFDDTAEDDKDYVISQIAKTKNNIKGELVQNPKDESLTYAMPYHGKGCYLFIASSVKHRLDSELAKRYHDKSRSTWQKHIKLGHICVNGQVILSPKHDVLSTDDISINTPDEQDYSSSDLPILYLDDNVIVINKPCGVLSHSKGAINEEFTVADFFKRYSTFNAETNRCGIVHRLDRDTSGVMIGARNEETAISLQKQFADRKTKKVYYAIVVGNPKLSKANIDVPIIRNPSEPSKFKVDPKGKSAFTRYDVVESNDKYSLIKLQPKTGRTHQLRVHMSYINTPILGDRMYGKESKRLYLHAASLEITIPSGIHRVFQSPLPSEFSDIFSGSKL
jgi:23S rRNA pseudouridine1911/1915/1917 synthase